MSTHRVVHMLVLNAHNKVVPLCGRGRGINGTVEPSKVTCVWCVGQLAKRARLLRELGLK